MSKPLTCQQRLREELSEMSQTVHEQLLRLTPNLNPTSQDVIDRIIKSREQAIHLIYRKPIEGQGLVAAIGVGSSSHEGMIKVVCTTALDFKMDVMQDSICRDVGDVFTIYEKTYQCRIRMYELIIRRMKANSRVKASKTKGWFGSKYGNDVMDEFHRARRDAESYLIGKNKVP